MNRGSQVKIIEVNEYKKQSRRIRKPNERFAVRGKPMEIVPFMCHPVLPGESLDSCFLQDRVVSDPIAGKMQGWWQDYYIFYVPVRALVDQGISPATVTQIDAADFNNIWLDPTFSLTTTYSVAANDTPYYMFKGGVRWIEMIYETVVSRFFRDEDEALGSVLDAYYPMQTDQKNWAHSLKEESAGTDDVELPGQDDLEELDILPGFTTHYAQWELMRDQGMIELSYPDYLRSYGITVPKDVQVVDPAMEPVIEPELLYEKSRWTYPTLAPQVGSASTSSVAYWSVSDRFESRKLFMEPGFIFGVCVTKPKLYLGNQKGHFVGLLDNAYAWLPAVLNHLPYTSIKEALDSATDGILQGGDEDYWLDVKDGFIHGGQFLNYSLGVHAPAMPVAATLQKKYVTEAMMDSLFSTTDGTQYVYHDGSAQLEILGKLKDTSPQQ